MSQSGLHIIQVKRVTRCSTHVDQRHLQYWSGMVFWWEVHDLGRLAGLMNDAKKIFNLLCLTTCWHCFCAVGVYCPHCHASIPSIVFCTVNLWHVFLLWLFHLCLCSPSHLKMNCFLGHVHLNGSVRLVKVFLLDFNVAVEWIVFFFNHSSVLVTL